MAELFGRVDGCSRGPRRLDAHVRPRAALHGRLRDRRRQPADRRRVRPRQRLPAGTDDVTLCMFGDGASNQGTFGETMNLAALWKLPVVFMVTNNQFGMGTALERHSAVTDLQRKGEGFGVPGHALRRDGRRSTRTRVDRARRCGVAREERRPVLVEAVTYRFRGHSMADPEEYRTKEQVARVARARPDRARSASGSSARACIDDGRARSRSTPRRVARVDEAVAFADASPFPAPESLYDDVYVLGDQVRGWYSVDERSPSRTAARTSATRRRRERGPAAPQRERRSARPTTDAAIDAAARTTTDGASCATARRSTQALREELHARRARDPDGRGHRRLQRRLQGHRGPAGGVRRAARARHADLREHDRRHGRRRGDDRRCARSSS